MTTLQEKEVYVSEEFKKIIKELITEDVEILMRLADK